MIHSTKHNTAIVKKHRSRVGKSLPLAALLLLLLSGAYAFALPGADADEPGTYSPGSVIEAGVIWKNAPEKITCNSKKGDFSFIFHPDASSEITTLRVFIKGGKRAEPVNRKGTAFIATRLAMEVTELRDVRKIMTMGSSSMTQVEADYSVITINCLTEHFRDTLKIFSSYMRNPLLSSIRISNIKSALKHYQKNENDQPEHAVLKVLHDVFFGEDGYGGSIYGTKESLKKIKRKDVISFHKTYFNLANMVIVISSDMAKEKVKKIISDYFGTLPKGEPHPLAAVKRVPDGPSKGGELNDGAAKSKEHFIEKENTQSLITVAVPLPGMNVSNYICASLLENILGEGIGARLWPIRARKNLAYHLAARATCLKQAGILHVLLKTDHSKKEKAKVALEEVLAKLYREGVGEEEFTAALIRARAHFLRRNETKEKRTYNLGFFETIGPGFRFIEDFCTHLETITREQLNNFITETLAPGKMVRVIIGPGK